MRVVSTTALDVNEHFVILKSLVIPIEGLIEHKRNLWEHLWIPKGPVYVSPIEGHPRDKGHWYFTRKQQMKMDLS
ncbi:hypothetical protein CDAR_567741 [Caerostris darwini]|uniref:Uncharacterized protein n=1 Tax=Caerostris darwini TaxID=1538125 RepID=A0AAV4RQY1_9ARAC|nr:hypothetical protein CDAR_567741 [Caerostris darwini]